MAGLHGEQVFEQRGTQLVIAVRTASSTAARPSPPALPSEPAASSARRSTSDANSAWRSPKSPLFRVLPPESPVKPEREEE